MTKPVFRFAPSPNGHLHLGHAYSALLNQKMAREAGGKLLLRIEDIDITRCTPELEAQVLRDLEWIGFEWDEEPRRQSEHFDEYREALEKLNRLELIYPSNLSRSEIKKIILEKKAQGIEWLNDPDGTPLYPGNERELSKSQRIELQKSSDNFALRLDIQATKNYAVDELRWTETSHNQNKKITANPLVWGDVIIGRKDFPVSYHLCCTLDDALQGITHVVRGKDQYEATSIHILMFKILELEKPNYHHHKLIEDDNHQKLSKSEKHTSLIDLRKSGITANQIKEKLGFV